MDPVLGTPLHLRHTGGSGCGTASHPCSQGWSQKAPETWEHPVSGIHCIQAGSLEERIMLGTLWSPGVTVPGIQGSPRAPGSSSQDTHGDQNSGVIWRGSSGRMLTESSARPQSRHSMVYSWGKEKGGGWKKGGCHGPAPPQGNLSQIRYPIPDCNQSQGISFPAPLAPLRPFSSGLLHRRCARNEEWGSQPPPITHIPMPGAHWASLTRHRLVLGGLQVALSTGMWL